MLDAVERHYPLAHRWFAHKQKLLGVDQMVLAYEYAPIGGSRSMSYREAVELVLESFGEFSPRIEKMAFDVFADNRLDAEPRNGKRGGAFCASIAQDAKPFILMNFLGKLDDVRTLAHELGHGMQFESRARYRARSLITRRSRSPRSPRPSPSRSCSTASSSRRPIRRSR